MEGLEFPFRLLYLCAGPEVWGLKDITAEKLGAGHYAGRLSAFQVLWPQAAEIRTWQPAALADLGTRTGGIKDIVVVDRLRGVSRWVWIRDHVNRSGDNALIGNTPFGGAVQFPDLSRMYHPIEDLEGVIVHTLGTARFANPPDEAGSLWSEAAGIVAPALFYAGFRVYALGNDERKADLGKVLKECT